MSAEMIRDFHSKNINFATNHKPAMKYSEFPNMKAAMIVTCMDPRCNPHDFWALPADMGPAIVRNAGGRVTDDTLRSIRVLSTVMSYGRNTVGVVAVVHHTDCGGLNFTESFIRGKLKERVPERAAEIDAMIFGALESRSIEKSVKHDVQLIRNDPFLPKDLEVIGFEYDVFSGRTREIEV